MKKIFALLMGIIICITVTAPLSASAQVINPIVEYTFENDTTARISNTATGGSSNYYATLKANAKIVNDSARGRVLYLDGTDGTYMELKQGLFDGRDEMTITMDVKSLLDDGNFFTFAYGADNTKYAFLRVRGYETCFIVSRNGNADENYAGGLKARTGKWHTITMVISNGATYLYVNGVKIADGMRNDAGITTTELGENLKGYIGKSFYDEDLFFKGYYDNIRIYDRALSDSEVTESVADRAPLISSAIIGTTVDKSSKGTDNHTSAGAIIDNEALTITPYVKPAADLKSLPMTIKCISDACTIKVNGAEFKNGSNINLTTDKKFSVTYKDRTQTYTIKAAQVAYNPALPGQYADPDIDYFDGKYWMFPTTDGYDWWSGTQFHAFSSKDLQTWTDEGVVLDVADKEPGLNAKGVQIASCPWSNVNAWAPSIEAKNGKYYLYFCANYVKTNRMAIGVAVADNPAGPYTVKETPLISDDTPVRENTPLYANGDTENEIDATFRGQTIDPSIFTEDDGTSYILFGNGTPAMLKLNEDMMSVDVNSYARVNQGHGLPNFCESVYCVKRNGIYHFTWSCFGTDDERYSVGYGTATSLKGRVTYRYTLMKENEEIGALCTAHQSIVYRKDIDKCYIAYHRFYTPLGIYTDQYGKHREACVDEIKFDSNGLMKKTTPTMIGITKPASDLVVTLSATSYTYNGTAKKPTVTVKEKNGSVIPKTSYTVSYANNVSAGTASVTVKVSCKYSGTVTKKFTIKPKDATGFNCTLSSTSYTYNGSLKKPTVTVKNVNGAKLSSSNYTVTYSNNKYVGKATATVKFKGNYTGAIKKTFTIKPKGTSIASLSAGSKRFTVKWKKQSTQTTGYQIEYSTSSKFPSNTTKTVTVSKNSTTSKTVSKLKAKKKYYVRIRTYKTVNGTKYYSAWSGYKSVTTKK